MRPLVAVLLAVSVMWVLSTVGSGWRWLFLLFLVAALVASLVLLLRPSAATEGVLRESRVGLFLDVVFMAVTFLPLASDGWSGLVGIPVWAAVLWSLPFLADAARFVFEPSSRLKW